MPRNPFVVDQVEHEVVALLRAHAFERHAHEFGARVIEVGNLPMATPELRVPADARQQFVNGDHGRFALRAPARTAMAFASPSTTRAISGKRIRSGVSVGSW